MNAMRALMRRAVREMTGGVGIKAPPIRAAGTTPGATKELTIGSDDRGVALAALNGYVPRAWRSDGLLRVVVEGEARAIAAAVNSRLVEPG